AGLGAPAAAALAPAGDGRGGGPGGGLLDQPLALPGRRLHPLRVAARAPGLPRNLRGDGRARLAPPGADPGPATVRGRLRCRRRGGRLPGCRPPAGPTGRQPRPARAAWGPAGDGDPRRLAARAPVLALAA